MKRIHYENFIKKIGNNYHFKKLVMMSLYIDVTAAMETI